MSEKSFIYGKELAINSEDWFSVITDTKHKKTYCRFTEVVDLLNNLCQENQELKEDLEFNMRTEIAHHRVIEQELKEKNEQLKGEIEEFKEVIIDKVQYGEDNLEEFLIKKGIISEDWARFDGYD